MNKTSTVPAKQRRVALETLSRDRLAALTQHYELSVSDRRVVKHHVDALVQARRVEFADLLAQLKRDELKAMCQALGLDDSGREKQRIIDRILALGTPAGPAAPAPEQPAPADPPAGSGRKQRQPRAKARAKPGAKIDRQDKHASLGFENKLWEAADLLRNNMDPAEYKHVVLGLIFLKYISDAFKERRAELIRLVSDPDSDEYVGDPIERQSELDDMLEDPDEYMAENVFWVPSEARWQSIRGLAKQADIGKSRDDAMDAIERDNAPLSLYQPNRSLPCRPHKVNCELLHLLQAQVQGCRL